MNITKVLRTSADLNGVKSLIIHCSDNFNFSFEETDLSKEKYEGEWSSIQAWVSAGNTIEQLD